MGLNKSFKNNYFVVVVVPAQQFDTPPTPHV